MEYPPKYRREIDGLRAIAILPVILFHSGVDVFSGGYVGVDVFFVISGYLITGILLTNGVNNNIDLVGFYERRARRILPALFFVILVCIFISWLILLPSAMRDFSKSVGATIAFAANILFWRQSGYFDVSAELKPLLHMWSLSVEEQFYLLFPILLFSIRKWTIKFQLATLILLGIASIVMANWMVVKNPSFSFYMLPTRAWELLIGASLAVYSRCNQVRYSSIVGELGALSGVFLLGASIFFFDKSTPFPGVYAIVPTAGAALVILFAQPTTKVGAFLGTKLLVGIGLISYSAYLWHQPLLAFYRIHTGLQPTGYLLLIIFISITGLSIFSWHYVEKPFRKTGYIQRKTILTLSVIFTFLFSLFSVVGVYSDGFKSFRFASSEIWRLNTLERRSTPTCEITECATSDLKPTDWLLIGDSNAYHFSGVLQNVASSKGHKVLNLSKGGCAPLLHVLRKDQSKAFNEDCSIFYSGVKEYALLPSSPKNIIIAAAWELYVFGNSNVYDSASDQEGATQLYPDSNDELEGNERIEWALSKIEKEITEYVEAGKRVIFVYPMPFLINNLPNNHSIFTKIEGYSHQHFLSKNHLMLDRFEMLTKRLQLESIRIDLALCQPQGICIVEDELGGILYGDKYHLSGYGAEKVFGDYFGNVIH